MTYASEVLADSPVGYWKLDESGLPSADSSGNSLTLTSGGASGTYTSGSAVAPPMGGTYSLNVNNGSLGVGMSSPSARPWTMECFFYPTTRSQGGAIMHRGEVTGSNGISLGVGGSDHTMDTDGLEVIVLIDGVAWKPSGFTLPAINRWYHLAATDDSTNIRFYVNGALVATTTTAAPSFASNEMHIGREQTSGRYVLGNIAQVAIYGTALSTARILAHANASGLDITYQNRVLALTPDLYWPFDEDIDVEFPSDWSGNNSTQHAERWSANTLTGGTSILSAFPFSLGATGAGGYMSSPSGNGSALDPGTGDFSLGFWIDNCTNTSDYINVGGRDSGETGNYVLLFFTTGTGTVRFYCGGSSVDGSVTVADGNLHLIGVERASGTCSIFVDGVLDATFSNSSSVSNAQSLRIGRSGGSYNPFLGNINAVFWRKAATGSTEWAALYAAGTGAGSITGTVAVTAADATSAASGSSVTGSTAVTAANATSVASGTVTPPAVTGTVSISTAAASSSASGTATPPAITGTAALTTANVTSSALGSSVVGTVVVSTANATCVASGAIVLPAQAGGTNSVELRATVHGGSLAAGVHATIIADQPHYAWSAPHPHDADLRNT